MLRYSHRSAIIRSTFVARRAWTAQPVLVHHHIRWFQVAVDDAFVVSGFDSFGNLAADVKRLVWRDTAFSPSLGERLPFDQFQNKERFAIGLFQSVDCGDVGMIQRR